MVKKRDDSPLRAAWRWPHVLSPLADLLYGTIPAPTFQLPDGRLQPDFLMDTVPSAVFFLITFGLAGAICYYLEVNQTPFEYKVAFAVPVLVHWALFFGHGLPKSSEKYFDLAGQIGFCFMLAYSALTRSARSARSDLVIALSFLWSVRLGYFLFSRMLERGEDWRFIRARKHPGYHFFAWSSQGFWCFFQGQAILALHHFCTLEESPKLGTITDYLGLFVWAAGLGIETLADIQKLAYVRQHPNRNTRRWIDQGLWSYSRHPNFFGESTCWVGLSLLIYSGLGTSSSEINKLIFAPIFSAAFLMNTSVPWLDLLADAKYGRDPDYAEYVRSVSKYVLLPRRPTWL